MWLVLSCLKLIQKGSTLSSACGQVELFSCHIAQHEFSKILNSDCRLGSKIQNHGLKHIEVVLRTKKKHSRLGGRDHRKGHFTWTLCLHHPTIQPSIHPSIHPTIVGCQKRLQSTIPSGNTHLPKQTAFSHQQWAGPNTSILCARLTKKRSLLPLKRPPDTASHSVPGIKKNPLNGSDGQWNKETKHDESLQLISSEPAPLATRQNYSRHKSSVFRCVSLRCVRCLVSKLQTCERQQTVNKPASDTSAAPWPGDQGNFCMFEQICHRELKTIITY